LKQLKSTREGSSIEGENMIRLPPPPERRSRRPPSPDWWYPRPPPPLWLIPTFVMANLVLFILTMYENNCPSIAPHSCLASFLGILSFQPITQNPLPGSSPLALVKMGAMYFKKSNRLHHAYRLFTCLWLHAGVIDLLLNMFNILYYDLYLEKKFGSVWIAILHTMSGMGSS